MACDASWCFDASEASVSHQLQTLASVGFGFSGGRKGRGAIRWVELASAKKVARRRDSSRSEHTLERIGAKGLRRPYVALQRVVAAMASALHDGSFSRSRQRGGSHHAGAQRVRSKRIGILADQTQTALHCQIHSVGIQPRADELVPVNRRKQRTAPRAARVQPVLQYSDRARLHLLAFRNVDYTPSAHLVGFRLAQPDQHPLVGPANITQIERGDLRTPPAARKRDNKHRAVAQVSKSAAVKELV
jgi:hypothetical protein